MEGAERLARDALEALAGQSPDQHGWSLLAGHAGVYCTAALVLESSAHLAERRGWHGKAAVLRHERQQAVHQFVGLHGLACSSSCQEDEAREAG